jgi:ribosomal subunit interface protein
MQFEVTFKNLAPRDEIRERAELLHGKLSRFLDDASETRLVVGVEHGSVRCELATTTRGDEHHVVEEDADMRTAMDRSFHTLETSLRRAKERRTAARRPRSGKIAPVAEDDGNV